MSSFSVVLDTCVLYPMYLRDTLLRAAEAGLYRLYWSADILKELRRNIIADGHARQESADHLIEEMRIAFPEADVTSYHHLIPAMRNDPKDRHVVAAAVVAGAQLIVTDNLSDFGPDALAPFNIEAQSADAFLTDLFSLDLDAMVAIISAQAGDYAFPPLTPMELLDRLARTAPTFAELVRAQLST